MLTYTVSRGLGAPTSDELAKIKLDYTASGGYTPMTKDAALEVLKRFRPEGNPTWDFFVTESVDAAGGSSATQELVYITRYYADLISQAFTVAGMQLVIYQGFARLPANSPIRLRIAAFDRFSAGSGSIVGWIGTIADAQVMFDKAIAKIEAMIADRALPTSPPPSPPKAQSTGMSRNTKVGLAVGGGVLLLGLVAAVAFSGGKKGLSAL